MAGTRRAGSQRYLPIGYMAAAVALAALTLPTALRPPQDLQSQTTAFSPDAPPDEAPPEAILQSLRQARSSTAGGVTKDQVVQEEETLTEEEEVAAPPPPPPPPKKAARGRCFGDPPRQTESVYSALCVPAFTGDNGGATAKGVTADEIRLGVIVALSATVEPGRLPSDFSEADTPTTRHLKVWQAYYNERYEFYGRYLRFYIIKASDQDEDQARAAIAQAEAEFKLFGVVGDGGASIPSAAMVTETVKQKMITFAVGQNPVDYYADNHPYVYSFTMDSWQTRHAAPELACNLWAGKPPGDFNAKQDVTFDYTKPRKWGLILYQDEIRTGARQQYEKEFAKCGGKFDLVQEYNITDNQQAIAGTAAKMKQAGVTTIMFAVDPLTPAVVVAEAERIQYFPEYIGVTGLDSNGTGRLMNDNQSEHFVTMRAFEMPRAHEDKDWFRAYKEVDPDGDPPDGTYGPGLYRAVQQFSGGVQLAGTKLTPETFWQGLKQTPCRTPDPVWSIGGCYKDPDPTSAVHFLGDYTYSDYIMLSWFDLKGDDPESTETGAYCFMHGGRRYRVGEFPKEPLPFKDPKQCIITPARGQQG